MKSAKTFRRISIALLLFGFQCCRESTPTGVNPPDDQDRPSYRIAFVSDRDLESCFQVYIMDNDGCNQTRLTQDSLSYYHPQFSPDGMQIVFYSSVFDDNDEIYIINADGSDHRNLSNSAGNDNYPQFSPDGSKIVFTSDRDGNREIYVMDSDGSQQQRLTDNATFDHAPRFSPDGSQILFFSVDDGWNYDLWTMDTNGGNLERLTPPRRYRHVYALPEKRSPFVYFHGPRYGPDGKRIVFTSYSLDGLDFNIYAMNSDGSEQIRLTSPYSYNFAPQYSPIGSHIFFISHRGSNYAIYSMRSNGSDQIPLYERNMGNAVLSQPSPDGSKILFMHDRWEYETYKIFIMDSNGSNVVQLTQDDYNDYSPQFQPVSSQK